jgi:DNA-binding transcriptional ArsR family regulator
MSRASGDPERAVNGLISVAQLLDQPRLARLYTFVLREGEVTVDNIVAQLELPRTTAYSDTATLVDLGMLERDDEQKTHRYTAVPVILTANLEGNEYTITPTLVEAFGRSEHDKDLALVLERHGPGKLAAALAYAVPYASGEMSERVAARELGLQHAVAVAVLHALREVVLDMRAVDPYIDQIRDAREQPPEG